MTPLKIALFTVGGLAGAAVVFVIVVVILVFTGGPSLEAACGDRSIDTTQHTSAAFDNKWDAFDDRVAAGQPSTVAFDEAELTQRVQAFLIDEDIEEIKEVTICLFADGSAEAKGKIDVPVFPDISASIKGRVDLVGNVPVFSIDDFDVGNTGFLVDAFGAEGEVEDGVNEALEKLDLKNAPYGVAIGEGVATVNGG
jgi:hypothetical protein